MSNQTLEVNREVADGRFVRRRSAFRDRITTPEAGRHHLCAAPATTRTSGAPRASSTSRRGSPRPS